MKLGIPEDGDLGGKLFVTSGLGGMSGAQGKAAEIANCTAIVAEVDYSRIKTRLDQDGSPAYLIPCRKSSPWPRNPWRKRRANPSHTTAIS